MHKHSLIKPLRKVNLVAEVVEHLESQILSGRYSDGQDLPVEARLSHHFGVSRTVIREAIRILSGRGLVEASQGRPTRVRPADPEHVQKTIGVFLRRGNHSLVQLVEVRRPLESEIAALAAQRATAEQLRELEAANEELARSKKIEQLVEADLCFHNLLAEATGNPVFGLLLKALVELLRRSRRKTLARTGKQRALTGHGEIYQAVRRGHPEQARAAMLRHLQRAEEDLQTKPS
ncbi:MAG: FadR family transcriptional regulator [Pirellulales bacterium]|nr:FadR family transcriptional regulator [Pirellulales bacterium]